MQETIIMLLMIAAITAGLISYAVVFGQREDQESRSFVSRKTTPKPIVPTLDPDAHLGSCGGE